MKPICKFMGKTGIDALTRIMGFLLVSMGMQFMINAVKDLLTDPAFQVLCNVN
ncbi:MarC family protein [Shewanella sp. JNE17]|nr:MarC family protein [Shewanella sp. JNE17]